MVSLNLEGRPDFERLRSTRQRLGRIRRGALMWSVMGCLVLALALFEPTLPSLLLGVAWIGLGWAVVQLADAILEVEVRSTRLEAELSRLRAESGSGS